MVWVCEMAERHMPHNVMPLPNSCQIVNHVKLSWILLEAKKRQSSVSKWHLGRRMGLG